MKKRMGILLATLLILSFASFGAQAEAKPVEGATFTEVTDVGGIAGSRFYLYVPSNLESPYPMMTPVIYVYGDQPYQDLDAAWAMITEAGLDTIAEDEQAAIIAVNPVGENWGKEDVEVFEAIMSYISYVDGAVQLTYHSLQYAIGEGSGATFVNNYLTQNCKRIAAVMTFGGEIANPHPLYALPAYIVSGSREAVDFYRTINYDGLATLPTSGRVEEVAAYYESLWVTEETEEKLTYVNTANDVKRVIVSKAESTSLNRDLISDCWESLFRYTARACLTANFWQYDANHYNTAEFTLLKRPNYQEAGMEVIRVDGVGNGIWEDDASNYWYEFVPKAVQEAMESGSDETFPLMMCFHGGGDHPIYEAESVGWAQMCIDHNVIMVAPNGRDVENHLKLLDYMIEKYPVDLSRIYAGGFSGGARSTLAVSNLAPERFAAVAPQSCVSGPFYTDLLAKIGEYEYDLDLPILVAGQGLETESTNHDGQYVWIEAIQGIWEINEIAPYEGELDYLRNPYWGFPVEEEIRIPSQYGFALWQGYNRDESGVPLLCVMHSEQTTHTHYPAYAEQIWNYFQCFSRDPESLEIIYAPAR